MTGVEVRRGAEIRIPCSPSGYSLDKHTHGWLEGLAGLAQVSKSVLKTYRFAHSLLNKAKVPGAAQCSLSIISPSKRLCPLLGSVCILGHQASQCVMRKQDRHLVSFLYNMKLFPPSATVKFDRTLSVQQDSIQTFTDGNAQKYRWKRSPFGSVFEVSHSTCACQS